MPRYFFPILFAVCLTADACRKAPESSSPAAPVPSPQDTPPPPSPDTAAVDLRPATSAEVLAYVRDGGAPLTVVNFWATWCAPCIVEFPELMRANEALKADGVRLVFVSADDLTDRAAVRTFLARQGASGVAFQKNEDEGPFITAFSNTWTGTLPATFVYDRAGREVAYFDRPVTFEPFTDTLRALLRTSNS
ncbi:MAG TPA: TlpA disulfide reductase family protein [Rhodothermales bacterium]|nr:TlpA disulfide reductase family protein [Rhodothermales bacterium]